MKLTQIVRIHSAIRRSFPLSIMLENNEISSMKVAMIQDLPFLNNPKDLYPSYKTYLDMGIVLEGIYSVL